MWKHSYRCKSAEKNVVKEPSRVLLEWSGAEEIYLLDTVRDQVIRMLAVMQTKKINYLKTTHEPYGHS